MKQPTLVVNGHNDIMVPTINSFTLSQNIPNAQLILYPDAGHGALFQVPKLFVAHSEMFLNGSGVIDPLSFATVTGSNGRP
jgi:pimeloyl-ACP methyl ester carboxylesterase